MDVDICRVCGETSEDMVNIFDGDAIGIQISIAEMISQCTGHQVSREDPLPKTICAPCKRDATNAFEIKQLYETSHSAFCQMIKGGELQEEEMLDISYSKIGKLQIKNEPVEEDIFEDVRLQFTEFEVDEEFKENVQPEDQLNDTNDQENTSKTSHICSYCKKSFSQKCNLQSHIRTHTGERPFKCSHCEKSFAQSSNLQRHILAHKDERPYTCSVCLKTFKSDKYLQSKQHLDTHEKLQKRPYKCSHKEERPYTCSVCLKTFKTDKYVQSKSHLKTHEKLQKRPYKCSHCQKTFAKNQRLQEHDGDWPYKCLDCEQSFRLKKHLKEHKQTHDQKRDEL